MTGIEHLRNKMIATLRGLSIKESYATRRLSNKSDVISEASYSINLLGNGANSFKAYLNRNVTDFPETRPLFIALNASGYRAAHVMLLNLNSDPQTTRMCVSVESPKTGLTILTVEYSKNQLAKRTIAFEADSAKPETIDIPLNFSEMVNSMEGEKAMRAARDFSATVNLTEYIGLSLLAYYNLLSAKVNFELP